MTWLRIIFWLLTSAPDIIALIQKFLELFRSMPSVEQDAVKHELSNAFKRRDVVKAREILTRVCAKGVCK